MPAACFYFQLHQPRRLKRYNVFNTSSDYFEDGLNAQIMRRVADRCYVPTTKLLADIDGFACGMSVTGSGLQQMAAFAPEAVDALQRFTDTANVEWLAETSHHALAFLYNPDEFRSQVEEHAALIEDTFDQRPTTFRHAELIYSDALATQVGRLGYDTILTEGADKILGLDGPNSAREGPHGIAVLLRNWRLSDAIAFRFGDPTWEPAPLTPQRFAGWVAQAEGDCVNLFMDYETFGEHLGADSGILKFLRELPDALCAAGVDLLTPTEAAERTRHKRPLSVQDPISWADAERDVTAWLGNSMQSNAAHELYKLLPDALRRGGDILEDWRDLTASDHLYYMATKPGSDGEVHRHFSPYDSPYDAYINFMNVLDNLRTRLGVAG